MNSALLATRHRCRTAGIQFAARRDDLFSIVSRSQSFIVGAEVKRVHDRLPIQASLWHFFIKLVFAAPASVFLSLPIALGSQASRVHFVMKLLSAAPANGLPSLPIAFLRQALSAIAVEFSTDIISKVARPIGFI